MTLTLTLIACAAALRLGIVGHTHGVEVAITGILDTNYFSFGTITLLKAFRLYV
jgi:hypothetical protein